LHEKHLTCHTRQGLVILQGSLGTKVRFHLVRKAFAEESLRIGAGEQGQKDEE